MTGPAVLQQRPELPQPKHIHEYQSAEPVLMLDGEAGRDGSAKHMSYQRGR